MSYWWLLAASGAVVALLGVLLIWKQKGSDGQVGVDFGPVKVSSIPLSLGVVALGLTAMGCGIYFEVSEQTSADRATIGTILSFVDPPLFPDVEAAQTESDRELLLYSWLLESMEAPVRVSLGESDGVREGSILAALPSGRLPSERLELDELGNVVDQSSGMLRVARVYDDESVAIIEAFGISAFGSRLVPEPMAGEVVFLLDPASVVVLIPAEEAEAHRRIVDDHDMALDHAVDSDLRRDRLQSASDACVSFLQVRPRSFFAPAVLFEQGLIEWELGDVSDAIGAFQLFLERFPLHYSREGAEKWLAELRAGLPPPSERN